MAKCPECGAVLDIDTDEIEEGEILSCPDCAVDLEIVSLHPLELNVLADEDEDDEEEGEEEESDADDESAEDEDERFPSRAERGRAPEVESTDG